jgi:ribosomal-protein-alanine N-acetyltransferase
MSTDAHAHERVSLETERLSLRPFSLVDVIELHALFLNRDVRRYLLDDQGVSSDWVEGEIRASDALFAAIGAGLWSARLRTSSEIIGCCGFRFFHDPPELQLLYALHPKHWGCGLATEAARAVAAYAFDILHFSEIIASTDVPNQSSIRVMERLGMQFDKRLVKAGLDTLYYRLPRNEF